MGDKADVYETLVRAFETSPTGIDLARIERKCGSDVPVAARLLNVSERDPQKRLNRIN